MATNCDYCLNELITQKILPETTVSYCLTNREKQVLLDNYDMWILKDVHSELQRKEVSYCVNILTKLNKCEAYCPKELKAGHLEQSFNYEYIFEKKLGEGSFGEVWKAVSKNLDTGNIENVAVKTFKKISEEGKRHLQIEVQCLQNIQPVCEEYAVCYKDSYMTLDGSLRLVIEYIEGRNLDDMSRKVKDKIRKELSYKIIKELALGLNSIHNLEIAHQDIKPENIMYDENKNRFRYLDWGLCCTEKLKQFGYLKKCGTTGTLYITPPELYEEYKKNKSHYSELIRNQNFQEMKAHDIWSLGIVLLRFLANTRVENLNFPRYFEFTKEQLWESVNPIKTGNKEVSENIFSMLEQDPLKRISNFEEIVSNFQETE